MVADMPDVQVVFKLAVEQHGPAARTVGPEIVGDVLLVQHRTDAWTDEIGKPVHVSSLDVTRLLENLGGRQYSREPGQFAKHFGDAGWAKPAAIFALIYRAFWAAQNP